MILRAIALACHGHQELVLENIALRHPAIVATDDLVFGMARRYAILTEDTKARVEVFRDVESANRWLQEVSG